MAGHAPANYKDPMTEHHSPGGDDPPPPPGPRAGILPLETFASVLEPGRRLLGLDVGTVTVGLALSDVGRMIASGLETVRRTKFKADAARLLELAASHAIAGFVIGHPLNLDGSSGPRAQATRAFARNLAALSPLPILLWDERLSTAEAERLLISADTSRRRRAEVIDKLAATIILQGALDRLRVLAAASANAPSGN